MPTPDAGEEVDWLQEGRRTAVGVLSAGKGYLESLEHADLVQWWAGFLAAAMGCAGASIGGEAAKRIADLCSEEVDRLAKDTRQ